jgi:hypothetical protein
VLLLTWNQAHFRYGSFDFQLLEQTLIDEQQQLGYFRDKDRDILRYVPTDDPAITSLFNEFLEALRIRGAKGKKNNSKSPVAVAKALHLLAPSYFPLWDNKIAGVYKCNYGKKPADAYLRFVKKMRHLAEHLTAQGVDSTESGVTLLKLIDEYNYATYTKHWRYRKVRTTQ